MIAFDRKIFEYLSGNVLDDGDDGEPLLIARESSGSFATRHNFAAVIHGNCGRYS